MQSESLSELKAIYEGYRSRSLNIVMTRGVPCTAQLDISQEILGNLSAPGDCIAENGAGSIDCRSYGLVTGIPQAKKLFASMLGVRPDSIIIDGNSSLNMMFDTISRAYCFGILGGEPWCRQGKIKFLCPVPGYDRHFAICELFGIEMINVAMTPTGPDMDEVERLVSSDEAIKGIWCVPKYSNPEGITYSDETVRRFARLNPAAKDFRVFWDNAYCVHDLYDDGDELLNIQEECEKSGNEDLVFIFGSTSKITFPGSGVSMFASSAANIEQAQNIIMKQTIGPDKLNQLRHVKFFGDLSGIKDQMKRHAQLLRPKFETVLGILERELGGTEAATWSSPRGGYFISLDTADGCAKRVFELAADAGLSLTPVGATFPYGRDPRDRNIRLAVTFPTVPELETATELLCVCVKLAYAEKYGS